MIPGFTYTTSNENVFSREEDGSLKLNGRSRIVYNSMAMHHLEKFMEAEKDQELGRWRSKTYVNFTVYPNREGGITVLDERKPALTYFLRTDTEPVMSELKTAYMVAQEYFDSHPEHPWQAAKDGEFWLLQLKDGTRFVALANNFGDRLFPNLNLGDPVFFSQSEDKLTIRVLSLKSTDIEKALKLDEEKMQEGTYDGDIEL